MQSTLVYLRNRLIDKYYILLIYNKRTMVRTESVKMCPSKPPYYFTMFSFYLSLSVNYRSTNSQATSGLFTSIYIWSRKPFNKYWVKGG